MRQALIAVLIVLGIGGCGANPAPVADRVAVTGRVAFASGKPVKDVTLALQPLGCGHVAGFKLGADGLFRGEAVPGRYAYFFVATDTGTAAEKQRSLVALRAVPQAYRAAHMEHTLAISSAGGELRIQLP